jgi:trehalose synthase
MTEPFEVHVSPLPFDRLEAVAGADVIARAYEQAGAVEEQLRGRVVWNINSTATGGGVAEMLPSLLGYSRGLGIDTRWLVIEGTPPFFALTKRLHHLLHGSAGDGGSLGDEERRVYEQVARDNVDALLAQIRPRDVVILHDPQTAGLAPHLASAGVTVIWRCHIGNDHVNEEVARGWAFLEPYLEPVHAFVFTREAYVPPLAVGRYTALIPPSIDPFTPKNEDLDEATTLAILVHTGLLVGQASGLPITFLGEDGSPRRVDRRAEVVRWGQAPRWDTPLVVQVSRWDPLKDPVGVMHGFASLVDGTAPGGAELVLAGPETTGVADDPEAARVLEQTIAAWRDLPEAARDRVHLVSLPTADVDENAVIVNALQRHARVVVQKSLQEGFGLTVSEALWKGRALLASAVGGIQDQIVDGEHGLLLADPTDLDEFGAKLRRLLEDTELADRLGRNGKERVRERFLVVRHLSQYADLLQRLDA